MIMFERETNARATGAIGQELICRSEDLSLCARLRCAAPDRAPCAGNCILGSKRRKNPFVKERKKMSIT